MIWTYVTLVRFGGSVQVQFILLHCWCGIWIWGWAIFQVKNRRGHEDLIWFSTIVYLLLWIEIHNVRYSITWTKHPYHTIILFLWIFLIVYQEKNLEILKKIQKMLRVIFVQRVRFVTTVVTSATSKGSRWILQVLMSPFILRAYLGPGEIQNWIQIQTFKIGPWIQIEDGYIHI